MGLHRDRKRRRLRNLKIKFLALTGNPAHGEPISVLKSMNSEPAMKGKIFESESKDEIDIKDSENKENLSIANVGMELVAITEEARSENITLDDVANRLEEVIENLDENLNISPSDNGEKVLSFDELKQTIKI